MPSPRYEVLEYPFYIPPFQDIEAWAKRAPTQSDVSTETVMPGCVVIHTTIMWLVMNVKVTSNTYVDLHMITFDREDGSIINHQQREHKRSHDVLWPTALYALDMKIDGDYCPHCSTALEWAYMAQRCPNCWWVR